MSLSNDYSGWLVRLILYNILSEERRTIVLNSMIYKVVVTPDPEDGGFTVSCPAISGCHSEGETIEEALENIKDAIQGCIGVLNERASRQQGSTVIDVSV
jgi:predicted RNase H-like HicB family nuclease